jgi:hypothetical protein
MWRGETAFLPNGAGIPTKVGILSVTISLTYQSDDMILHAGRLGLSVFTADLALRQALPECARSSSKSIATGFNPAMAAV